MGAVLLCRWVSGCVGQATNKSELFSMDIHDMKLNQFDLLLLIVQAEGAGGIRCPLAMPVNK